MIEYFMPNTLLSQLWPINSLSLSVDKTIGNIFMVLEEVMQHLTTTINVIEKSMYYNSAK